MDFVFKDKTYKVTKKDCYLSIVEYDLEGSILASHCSAVVHRFFEHFEIENCKEWLNSIYGYKARKGAFPEWREEDSHFMADKVLKALKNIYDGKSRASVLCNTNLLLLI